MSYFPPLLRVKRSYSWHAPSELLTSPQPLSRRKRGLGGEKTSNRVPGCWVVLLGLAVAGRIAHCLDCGVGLKDDVKSFWKLERHLDQDGLIVTLFVLPGQVEEVIVHARRKQARGDHRQHAELVSVLAEASPLGDGFPGNAGRAGRRVQNKRVRVRQIERGCGARGWGGERASNISDAGGGHRDGRRLRRGDRGAEQDWDKKLSHSDLAETTLGREADAWDGE